MAGSSDAVDTIWLKKRGLIADEDIATAEEEISDRIDKAWKTAEARIADLADVGPIFAHVLENETHELARQRKRMEAGLSPGGWSDG